MKAAIIRIPGIISVTFFFLCSLMYGPPYSEAEIYRYKDEHGVWCFTDSPLELPEGSESVENTPANETAIKDLHAQFSAKLPQRNEIERATCSVVAVKSMIGYGSGFFVTNDGYIITNKHVLKGDEQERGIEERRIESIEEEIRRIKRNLEKEDEELKKAKAMLDASKSRIDSQPNSPAKRHNLEQHAFQMERYRERERDLGERRRAFKEKEDEIEGKISSYTRDRTLAEMTRHFKILVADDTELDVYLISTSREHDLALLKLDGYRTPFLKPADPRGIPPGEPVYAIGNPAMLRNSVSKGIIAGLEGDFIKTDAKIYPGNSGGPLITRDGEVIGVNTFKELTRRFEGLGFAIPIRTALDEFRSELAKQITPE